MTNDTFFKIIQQDKKAKWKVSPGGAIRCNGYCPLTYVAKLKHDLDIDSLDYETASQALGISRQRADAIAEAADYFIPETRDRRKLRQRLLQTLGLEK